MKPREEMEGPIPPSPAGTVCNGLDIKGSPWVRALGSRDFGSTQVQQVEHWQIPAPLGLESLWSKLGPGLALHAYKYILSKYDHKVDMRLCVEYRV